MKECFRLQPQEDVIYRAAKTAPAPADAGPPVLAALKITPSCGREPVAPVTLTALLVPAPQNQRSARASRSCILHATPLTPLLCSVWRGRSPPTPVARPLHPRGLRYSRHRSEYAPSRPSNVIEKCRSWRMSLPIRQMTSSPLTLSSALILITQFNFRSGCRNSTN